METECVFRDRGYRCVWYECATCGWTSHSGDSGWSRRAGEVHEKLKPGHQVTEVLYPHEIEGGK